MEQENKIMIGRIAAAFVLTVAGAFLPDAWSGEGVTLEYRFLHLLPYLAAYLTVAWDILLKAAKNIRKGQVLDENFLMAVASLGAFGLGIYQNGDYAEAVAVMLFYQVGELFEDYAVDKSRWISGRIMPMWSGTGNWSGWTRMMWPSAPGSSSSPGKKSPLTAGWWKAGPVWIRRLSPGKACPGKRPLGMK